MKFKKKKASKIQSFSKQLPQNMLISTKKQLKVSGGVGILDFAFVNPT